MELAYPGKRSRQQILADQQHSILRGIDACDDDSSFLIEGDNAAALGALLHRRNLAESIDLIYIDPPYATNTVFRHHKDRTSTVSAAADSDIAYIDTRRGVDFLEFLRERLILLHELLSRHGSMFLHIDYKIGHYVKVIMDEVFGANNFRNDITRIKCNPKNFARKGFGNIKDMILFYSKGEDFLWHEPKVHLTDADITRLFAKVDANGRRYTTTPLHAPGETRNGNTGKEWRGMKPPTGRHWRYDPKVLDELDSQGLIEWSATGNPRKIIYADDAELKGKKLQDIWEFKDPQYPEYPTEKNLEMLRTIITACTNPGQIVLDCFCGSGTTLVAAEQEHRRWIGIDESPVAIETCKKRLEQVQGGLFGRTYGTYAVSERHHDAEHVASNATR
ncbi:MAG TPA: site-specific DNA-methyltransferase [Phycisphaerales bacterium]|nr:site-specific DNA-methyltransferase [Phycisphaerales bacterium]HRQ75337.1 site-specific DNA-methyltransferase [Phycisphaerales bacterium]